MSRAWKAVAISAGALLTLLVAAVLTLTFMDWDRFRGTAESLLSGAAGREIKIGHLEIHPGRTSRIVLRDLQIANADWAKEPQLAHVEEARITLDTLSLLGTPRLLEIELQRPVIHAERAADGRVSWDVRPVAEAAGEAAAPDKREEFPYIGALTIKDGKLDYRDEMRDLDLQGTIGTATGETVSNLELDLKGSLEGRPVRLNFRGGSLLQLRDSPDPYPFEVKLAVGETKVDAKGTAKDPVKGEGVAIQLEISGPSMAEVFPIFGIPLPATAPYRVEGHLEREGQKWRFQDFSGKVGDSDLRGTMSIDYTPERPYLNAVVESHELVFRDLAGLVGLDPNMLGGGEVAAESRKTDESAGILPDTPIDVERLKAMDMDVRLKSAKVTAPKLPITALDMHFILRDSDLRVEPLTFFVAEGKIGGSVGINAKRETPVGAADLVIDKVDLRPFFQNSQFVQEMGGRFVGSIDLKGSGKSFADMLGSSNGRAVIGMRDGSVSGLLVEAAGLDLVEALALLTGGDVAIRIRCGLLDATVTDGVARIERGLLDTTDSLLVVQGEIDLGKEFLDIQIEAREKDFSLIDAAAPVRVEGPFSKPSISIGGVDPLPFFEMGEQKDIDCNELLAHLGETPAQ